MPYVNDGGREYRMALPFEPAGAEGGYTVEGYATTYDVPYPFGESGMQERVAPTALANADMGDVIFQLNHEGPVLARQKNGTLALESDMHGLHVTADLGGSQQGRDLYEAISNGLIDAMSWGFTIADGGWEYDEETRTSTITDVRKVYDVSAVSIPADPDTELHARSYLDGVIEEEERESFRRDRERRARIARALEAELYIARGEDGWRFPR